MPQPDPANALNAVRMLDLLIEFFDGGKQWTKGRYEDGKGRRCLVAAINHVCGVHLELNRNNGEFYLHRALPAMPKPHAALMTFNDSRHHYREIAQLIEDARTLARRDVESIAADKAADIPKQQEAAARKRQLLAELARERIVRHAAGDTRETYILCPRAAPEQGTLEQLRRAA
jgi:hypothetical protein